MKIYFCEKCGISIPLQEVVAGRATARDGKTYCQTCHPPEAGGGDLKLYFCDNCRVSIPLQDVITNRAKAEGEQMLCADCGRLSNVQRRARKDRIQQDLKEKEESRYRLHFCDSCNTSIPQSHLVTGRAVVRGGRTFCERCRGRAERRKVSAAATVGGVLLLVVIFVGGYLALGEVPNLLAKSENAAAAPDREEALKKEILAEVADQVDADRKALTRQLEDLGALLEELKIKTELLNEGFAEIAETATEASRKHASLRTTLEERIDRSERSLQDAREKLAALAARLDEQKRIVAAAPVAPGPAPAVVPAEPRKPEPRAAPQAPPEVKQWVGQLADKDAGVRFSAAVELGKTGYKGAVEPLAKLLDKDDDTFVRRAAARSLGELDGWLAVPVLIDTLEAKEYFVAVTAHKALTKITGQDFGFRDGLSRSDVRKVLKKARDWWDQHKGDRTE